MNDSDTRMDTLHRDVAKALQTLYKDLFRRGYTHEEAVGAVALHMLAAADSSEGSDLPPTHTESMVTMLTRGLHYRQGSYTHCQNPAGGSLHCGGANANTHLSSGHCGTNEKRRDDDCHRSRRGASHC